MVFSSLTFLYLFLPLAVLPYFLVKNRTWRNGLLLVLSLFFYAWGEPKYVVMMLAATVVAYAGGLAIETLRGRPKACKVAFVLTVCLVTANLLVFKYANFLWDTLNSPPDHRPAHRHQLLHVPNSLLRYRPLLGQGTRPEEFLLSFVVRQLLPPAHRRADRAVQHH